VSELEHALRAALADPPVEPPNGVREPLWDIEERIHRRRRKQHRTAVAALACAAVAAVVVPLSVYGTPGGTRSANGDAAGGGRAATSQVQAAAPPDTVRTTTKNTADASGALHIDRTATWVRTTPDALKTATPLSASFTLNDQPIYLVKLTGRFVDLSWNPPAGPGHYKPHTVTTEFVVVPAHGGKAIVLQKRHIDLSTLGAVHTFTLR
jgi:hypothetical protein